MTTITLDTYENLRIATPHGVITISVNETQHNVHCYGSQRHCGLGVFQGGILADSVHLASDEIEVFDFNGENITPARKDC